MPKFPSLNPHALTSDSAHTPLFLPRIITLFLTLVFSIVGASLGVNSSVKSSNQKSEVINAIPAPTIVTIDTSDVQIPETLATTVCFLIFVSSFISLVLTFFRRFSYRSSLACQVTVLGGFTVWLFAVLTAATYFLSTGSAKVTAVRDGEPVPDSVIDAALTQLGVTGVYRKVAYLRNAIILQWFAFGFATIASIILAISTSRETNKRRDYQTKRDSYPVSTTTATGMSATKNGNPSRSEVDSSHPHGPVYDLKAEKSPLNSDSYGSPNSQSGEAVPFPTPQARVDSNGIEEHYIRTQ